jgi:UDP-N-acetylmuramoyl-tripeptide--D-alanyl-D-alanine ligase
MNAATTGTPLWTADEALAATAGRPASARRPAWQASGVSIDSRTCRPGDLFVALAGPNFDGHRFVAAALRAGAAAAIVAESPADAPADADLVVVEDTDAALTGLGRFARDRTGAGIAAITGSVGKTGTKEGLACALAAFGATHATHGNLNNRWGVPLSLARMPRDSRFGVFELGMNHAGELTPLSRLVRPNIAIVTTVAAAHLEFFANLAAIADAKAEIFAGMRPDGVAILNRDNPYFARLAAAATALGIRSVVGFGEHAEAQARLDRYTAAPSGGDVVATVNGRALAYTLAMPGRHAAINSLAILAAVEALGVDAATAVAQLARWQPPPGRGARRRVGTREGDFELIDDSYNASPAAVRAAIDVLAAAQPVGNGRRIAVLGDMLELGNRAPELHAELAGPLVAYGIDLVFTAGPNMAHLVARLPSAMRGGHADNSAELTATVRDCVRAGDVVLVKGSLGSRMAVVVDALSGKAAGSRTACAGQGERHAL